MGSEGGGRGKTRSGGDEDGIVVGVKSCFFFLSVLRVQNSSFDKKKNLRQMALIRFRDDFLEQRINM